MAEISSTYEGPNKLKTRTSGAPSEGYELLRALTYDRKGDYEERRAGRSQERPRKSSGGDGGSSARYEAPVRQEAPRLSPNEQALRNAQIRAEILRLKAMENPAPMRMVTGAGITPGYMMDVNAMNAYQRQAYLPTGSSFTTRINEPVASAIERGSDWGRGY